MSSDSHKIPKQVNKKRNKLIWFKIIKEIDMRSVAVAYREAKNQELGSNKKESFMAVRENVLLKKRELRKQLTPTQYAILDEIHIASVFDNFHEKAPCNLNELATNVGIDLSHLYRGLKILHEKGIIIRDETPYPRLEILGLNPEFFGQILINSMQENADRKPRLVVDNLSSSLQQKQQPTATSAVPCCNKSSNPLQKEYQSGLQVIDIIGEKNEVLTRSVDTIDVLDGSGTNFQFSGGNREPTQEEIQAAKNRCHLLAMKSVPKERNSA